MLELIFQGFIQWLYSLILECWEYFASALLDIMSLDFAYLKSHIPVIDDIMQVLLAAGWALLIGNLVFQAVRSMASGLGFEGEDPRLLFARTFVFAFLLLASPQICELGLELTSRIMEALQIPNAVSISFLKEDAFDGLAVAWLLVVVCGIIVMFKVFRLLLEIAERYVILAMLTITAPLAFSMGGSRSTSEIFTGWCRMFGSMCAVMALNVIFFKMLLSVLAATPSGLDVLPWMVLVLTITKVARKADAIVTRIGLNPAISGDSLGVRVPGALTYMVVRNMTSRVAKAVGKSAGGASRGASPGAPSAGSGPRSGGPRNSPSGGGNGAGAGGAGHTHQSDRQNTSQKDTARQSDSQQNTAQRNTQQRDSQQTATQQNVTHQNAAQQNARQGGPAPSNPQPPTAQASAAGTAGNPTGQARQDSRKSAVPPGTRRSPSHVKHTAANAAGKPAPDTRPAAGAAHTMGTQPPSGAKAGTAAQGGDSGTAGTAAHGGAPAGTFRPSQGGVAGKPPHREAPGKPGAARSGTAGTAGSARFTQGQTARGGAAGNTRTTERDDPSAGQARDHAAPVGGAVPKQQPGEARYTHRESVATQAGRPLTGGVSQPSGAQAGAVSQSGGPGKSGAAQYGTAGTAARPASQPSGGQAGGVSVPSTHQTGAVQSGTAGTAARPTSQPSVQEPRHGGNAPSVSGRPPSEHRSSSPARQESRQASASTPPPMKGGASAPRHGTAGTAPDSRREPRTQRTARGPADQPAPAGARGGGQRAPGPTAAQSGRPAPKGGAAAPKTDARPPRQNRGSDHGK